MRSPRVLSLPLLLVVIGAFASLAAGEDPPERRGHGRTGPDEAILLELFTSQG
jgi:hypothetical protein